MFIVIDSVCYSDIGDTKPHLIDLFSSSGTSQVYTFLVSFIN